jgi:hypothetical protein
MNVGSLANSRCLAIFLDGCQKTMSPLSRERVHSFDAKGHQKQVPLVNSLIAPIVALLPPDSAWGATILRHGRS